MADKKQDIKQNKIIEIIKTEYPFEKVFLAIMGLGVLIIGIYLAEGIRLNIKYTNWWVFDSPLKVLIFSIFMIAFGAIAFLYAIWPFFVPSFYEMKKVSWPNKKTIINHSLRVFGFIFFLSAVFLTYDSIFRPIFDRLLGVN